MSDFRDLPALDTTEQAPPTPERDRSADFEESVTDLAPIEDNGSSTLQAMGFDEGVEALPTEDRENLQEVESYLKSILNKRGLSPTVGNLQKGLKEVKESMGLDEDADPQVVLDRVGGIAKSWKNLSFVKDAKEKRSIFMKLSKLKTSQEMDNFVYEQMNKDKVWR